MAPIKSPNLILEFKRKVVGEGMVSQPTDTWGYSIVGEDKQKTETAALTAITRLKWRVLIYRYGQYQWVAGKGDPTPVPPPGGRQAENVAAPTVEQIAGALEGSSPTPAAAKRRSEPARGQALARHEGAPLAAPGDRQRRPPGPSDAAGAERLAAPARVTARGRGAVRPCS